ncbi:glycosyltransferase family 2 protein [bacterium]|nr:glycosyltransferase family 2 protein [bacterium]
MNRYLQKQAFAQPIISKLPPGQLAMFVVIPAYNEQSLLSAIQSLESCDAPKNEVEVLVVFNAGEKASTEIKEANLKAKLELDNYLSSRKSSHFLDVFTCLFNELPAKHAGVGLARKIGMDEAVRRFDQLKTDGIIINLDADCRVSKNYFTSIERHFAQHNTSGCSIFFEHPLAQVAVPQKEAIINYELYLRYYINMQRLIAYPFAYQTIGSAMAVKASVYCQQGGMNKRKAGEDFYFLQKIIEAGGFSELNESTVFASSRESNRVPFGTGKAVTDYLNEIPGFGFYAPQSFELLHLLFQDVNRFYEADWVETEARLRKYPEPLARYMQTIQWADKLQEIKKYTSNAAAFNKRFFREFNAFQLMKYLHWMRDNYYENKTQADAIRHLFSLLNLPFAEDDESNLITLRNYDKNAYYCINY